MAVTYEGGASVTPSDTTADPAGPFAGFYVGSTSAGAVVKLQTIRGDTLTLSGVLPGVIYPIAISRIWNSTTTATSIIGLVSLPYSTKNKGVGGT